MICTMPMPLSPSSLGSRGEGGVIFVTLPESILQHGLESLPEI